MKWLAATVALLALGGALTAWIYFRDRDTSGWRPPESTLARADALTVRDVLQVPCHHRCRVGVVANPAPHRWLTQIVLDARQRCFEIDVVAFSVTQQHGLSGVAPARCPSSP